MSNTVSILIVDDDLNMTETLEDILEAKGITVDIANDGFKAIEMVKKTDYQIVFMDIKMPGINGVETLKEFNAINPLTKVVMMTAYSLEELVREAIDEGAYTILYKPIDIRKFLEIIEKAFEGIFILIVDDDVNICTTLQDILEEKNYNVTTALSGKQAIELSEDSNYDIVILDVMMPIMDGLETYEKIKKINPKISTIMITGYKNEVKSVMQEVLRTDIHAFIYKPLDHNEIFSMIHEISKRKIIGKEISRAINKEGV
ncbi:MAG: response regulator [Candidatus Heimdallarchaeaceae archaeon]